MLGGPVALMLASQLSRTSSGCAKAEQLSCCSTDLGATMLGGVADAVGSRRSGVGSTGMHKHTGRTTTHNMRPHRTGAQHASRCARISWFVVALLCRAPTPALAAGDNNGSGSATNDAKSENTQTESSTDVGVILRRQADKQTDAIYEHFARLLIQKVKVCKTVQRRRPKTWDPGLRVKRLADLAVRNQALFSVDMLVWGDTKRSLSVLAVDSDGQILVETSTALRRRGAAQTMERVANKIAAAVAKLYQRVAGHRKRIAAQKGAKPVSPWKPADAIPGKGEAYEGVAPRHEKKSEPIFFFGFMLGAGANYGSESIDAGSAGKAELSAPLTSSYGGGLEIDVADILRLEAQIASHGPQPENSAEGALRSEATIRSTTASLLCQVRTGIGPLLLLTEISRQTYTITLPEWSLPTPSWTRDLVAVGPGAIWSGLFVDDIQLRTALLIMPWGKLANADTSTHTHGGRTFGARAFARIRYRPTRLVTGFGGPFIDGGMTLGYLATSYAGDAAGYALESETPLAGASATEILFSFSVAVGWYI